MSISPNHPLPNLQDRETFTQSSFEELITQAREKHAPFYLCAVTTMISKEREIMSYYDAESFDQWKHTATKMLDPLTNTHIRNISYVAINLFDFDARGVDHETDISQVNEGTNISLGLNGQFSPKFLNKMVQILNSGFDSTNLVEKTRHAQNLSYIGVSLYKGRDPENCKQDKSHARHWLLAAAKLGDAEAQYQLGRLHIEPSGTPQNHRLGKHWLKISAEKAHVMAQLYMGIFHEHCTREPAKALHWYKLADENGHPDCAALADKMTVQIQHQRELLN
ncbi:MAG: hypothetical protein ACI9S8_002836 [Chlamydiales bacterium]|jgi:hypothetical protein